MDEFKLERDENGEDWITIPCRGRDLVAHHLYNRGTAFTHHEREALGLSGLLPAGFSTIAEQCRRAHDYISCKDEPLEEFIGLAALERRNAVLFYRVLLDHLEEFLPIVYTPTVGLACQRFSHIFRRGRGLWITPEDRGRVDRILANAPGPDVRLIVVTDNERILGLGDQGAGGMWIPVGKLSLYIVGAGFHPAHCLPVSLDVGTDNPDLLEDELYMGWRHPRIRGVEYEELVDEFVRAVRRRFPGVLLQWEDFKKVNAFRLLDRYREEICSFNDDIQGTSAVALAGITAATRVSGIPLAEQRVVMVGGGAAGVGISRLLRDALSRCGLDAEAQRRAVAVLDSQGLIVEGRPGLDRHKLDFAWPAELVAAHGLPADRPARLAEVVAAFRPTVLIGTSGQPGIFDEATVREMARHVERPVILPFSNPTSMSEARPAELLAWTDGRALVATGSPFDPVEYGGRTVHIGQGNNVFVFPGVGLGAVVAGARLVTDAMFAAAADTLARQVTDDDLARGSLFPPLGELRRISKEIAIAVGLAAAEAGLAEPVDEPTLRARIGAAMWEPRYPRIRLPGS